MTDKIVIKSCANDVIDRLARIETKLDLFAEAQEENETRLVSVERKMNYGHGVVASLLFIATFFGDAIRTIIIGK
jgi:hypothetical protein